MHERSTGTRVIVSLVFQCEVHRCCLRSLVTSTAEISERGHRALRLLFLSGDEEVNVCIVNLHVMTLVMDKFIYRLHFWWMDKLTRMNSSRMRTVAALAVSPATHAPLPCTPPATHAPATMPPLLHMPPMLHMPHPLCGQTDACYHLQRSCEGNVFTPVCLSTGGVPG